MEHVLHSKKPITLFSSRVITYITLVLTAFRPETSLLPSLIGTSSSCLRRRLNLNDFRSFLLNFALCFLDGIFQS